jgi:hypothetical protein
MSLKQYKHITDSDLYRDMHKFKPHYQILNEYGEERQQV